MARVGVWAALPLCRKERLQQVAGAPLVDAAINLWTVVASRLAEEARAVLNSATLGIGGSKIEPPNASERYGLGAHWTGLEGDIEIAADQPRRGDQCGSGAQHQYLGMGGRIAQLFDAITIGGQHGAAAIDDDGADGHLAARGSRLGFSEGECHGFCPRHGSTLPPARGCVNRVPPDRVGLYGAAMSAPAMPLIGVTFDDEPAGGYSKFPWYALRQNYLSVLSAANALPMALEQAPDLAEAYVERLDGLVVTGGAFDVDPALFGGGARHNSVTTKGGRTAFELAVTRAALNHNLPVLGICGGQQLLAVALGGTLIQHIPDAISNALAHEQPNPRDEAGHAVNIVADTLLHRITGSETFMVNSAHHQAVDTVGEDTVVNALAPDGVIEGIEAPAYCFCLGVQWHPEFLISDGDRCLIAAFVAACRP